VGPVVRSSLHYVSAHKNYIKAWGGSPDGPGPPGFSAAQASPVCATLEMSLLFPKQPGWNPLCLVFRPNSQKQKEPL